MKKYLLILLGVALLNIGWKYPGGWQSDIKASDISVSTTNFASNLTITDDTVQQALETLDILVAGAGGVTDADYLVGTSNGSLSAEIVVGTTPGGILGGTWASPTLDSASIKDEHIDFTDVTIEDFVPDNGLDPAILGRDSTGAINWYDSFVLDSDAISWEGTETITVDTVNTNLIDGVGAVDIDYGSADITDHTFTTDGTGDAEIVLPNDSIGDAEIAFDEVTCADITTTDCGAITSTGVIDFGGATSTEIVNGASPTVNAAGEIALDTTDDQIKYYGAAERVLAYEGTKCISIENLAAADDNVLFGSFVDDVTITSSWCNCSGTCTTMATFSLEDGSGNAFTMATPSCDTVGTIPTAYTVTTDTITAREPMRFDVTNSVSPETDEYQYCVSYTVDSK